MGLPLKGGALERRPRGQDFGVLFIAFGQGPARAVQVGGRRKPSALVRTICNPVRCNQKNIAAARADVPVYNGTTLI
jgi:hypothetical protein